MTTLIFIDTLYVSSSMFEFSRIDATSANDDVLKVLPYLFFVGL
jgi:hypothetical protein